MPSGYMASAQLHSWGKEIVKVLNGSTCAHLFCSYICVHLGDSVNLRVLNDGKNVASNDLEGKRTHKLLCDRCETISENYF